MVLANTVEVISTAIMALATGVLAWATYRLFRATKTMASATETMAKESGQATTAYQAQTNALNALASAFSAGVEAWKRERDHQIESMRARVIWELDENWSRWQRYRATPVPTLRMEFDFDAWDRYRGEPLFAADDAEQVGVVYGLLRMCHGRAQGSAHFELPPSPLVVTGFHWVDDTLDILLGGNTLGRVLAGLHDRYRLPIEGGGPRLR